MSQTVSRFLGDSPGRTVLKLLVVSLIVGFVMQLLGIMPFDIIAGIRDFVADLWQTGFRAFGRIGNYLILGGTVVIPVFILIRILSFKR